MGKDEFTASLRLGRRRLPPLSVPSELFDLYQPMVGPIAVMVWLNLRWLIQRGDQLTDIEKQLGQRFGMSFRDVNTALQVLIDFELLECDEDGGYILHEPLSADAFALRFRQYSVQQPPLLALAGGYRKPRSAGGAETSMEQGDAIGAELPVAEPQQEPLMPTPPDNGAQQNEPRVAAMAVPEDVPEIMHAEMLTAPPGPVAASGAEVAASELPGGSDAAVSAAPPITSASTDLDAVVQIYHKRIGLIGPAQYEKLRFWVEEQKMDAEVVALAIEETVASARNPRINYLEGILRNWYNAGIRTLSDLMQDKRHSQALIPKDERDRRDQPSPRREGSANAAAYQHIDPDLVQRWKELYPDEYDE